MMIWFCFCFFICFNESQVFFIAMVFFSFNVLKKNCLTYFHLLKQEKCLNLFQPNNDKYDFEHF